MGEIKIENSSFRDRSGYIFTKENKVYRQINKSYEENYKYLIKSGLFKKLVVLNLLVPHREEVHFEALSDEAFLVIQPVIIPYITYPYEWCFSQLKDAALTTLKIQRIAMEYGMSLKDASAYNIQFLNSKPIFIDTLSFEKYNEIVPWIAYGQFCQHFLAPLTLMSYTDLRLNHLIKSFIDGIPLDLTTKLLPNKSKVNIHIYTHLFIHAKAQKKFSESKLSPSKIIFSKKKCLTIIDSLESLISGLKLNNQTSKWEKYYSFSNYSSKALNHKINIINNYLDLVHPNSVMDIGANTGIFSNLASNKGIPTISCDNDPLAIEKNYNEVVKNLDGNCLPLIIDIVNPSPALGWENNERSAFFSRFKTDLVMALAILHHLSISNNLPFEYLSKFFFNLCNFLIIEFIPKSDSQIQRLLSNREDIFDKYTQACFELEFGKYFEIIQKIKIHDSERTLYLMSTLKK